jgi:hypothetical protein
MTLTNRSVFLRDPSASKIPNDGVAKVVRPSDEKQWEVLRWELKSFVCDGQYKKGLERILDSFLRNLDSEQQPAVWVSGFYGSGKSHLVRVLEHLWRDDELPNGDRPRDLVELPTAINDQLIDLSNAAKRGAGVWSAAGTLGVDDVRLAFLQLLFASAGLHSNLPRARFTIWLRQRGTYDTVVASLERQGLSFDDALTDLYVSPEMAKALLEADPDLAESQKEMRTMIREQFPAKSQKLSDNDVVKVTEDILKLHSTKDGKLPLTLIVLDELQQYIDDDNDKAYDIQKVVEACVSRFESQVLFVATGQSELTATPTLQRLTDRFFLPLALSKADVETVVREVVLRKNPQHVPELQQTLDGVSGEINKHLSGTDLGPKAADKNDLVPDYPLLPTRRRFWELALRSIDRAGRGGQLRTQLRIVHAAAHGSVSAPIGHIVGADFLFWEQREGMLSNGALLPEIDTFIMGMRHGEGDDDLKARICALIFLLAEISPEAVGARGLRATTPFLVDLLVEDLEHDRARLHGKVGDLLAELVTDGRVMQLGDEYRLQTEVGAEWEGEYRSKLANIRDDAATMSIRRNRRLIEAVDAAVSTQRVMHGAANEPRNLARHWGQEPPPVSEGDIPVWIRDEWSVNASTFKNDAAAAGDTSPVVFVLLPMLARDEIRDALASHAAAEATLQRATPQTDEGREAQNAMQTRLATEDARLVRLFEDVVAGASVLQGGGNAMTTASFREAVAAAAKNSLVRQFSEFKHADYANWGGVVNKARVGDPTALDAVGGTGDIASHRVCKEVLARIVSQGVKGSALYSDLGKPPFGWPKDAVTAALYVLLNAGFITARSQEGYDVNGVQQLPQTQVGKTTFYKDDDDPPTPQQRMAVKQLLTLAAIQYDSGQEAQQIPELLHRLKGFAEQCGGGPPLPDRPDTSHLDEFLQQSGNTRFCAIADDHPRLKPQLEDWQALATRRAGREAEWDTALALLAHVDGLAGADDVRATIDAIRDGRQLLDEPNPLTPALDSLTEMLRSEYSRLYDELEAARGEAVVELENADEWRSLEPSQQSEILSACQLVETDKPDIASRDALVAALNAAPLAAIGDRISLIPSRRDLARQKAALLLEPESVKVSTPARIIKTPAELDAYLNEIRALVEPHLSDGKSVVI